MPASGVLAGSYNYLPPPLQGLYPGEYEVVLYPHSFATAGTGEAQAVSVFRIADFTLIVGGSLGLRDQLRRRLSLVFAVVFLPTAILLGLLSGRITPPSLCPPRQDCRNRPPSRGRTICDTNCLDPSQR